MSGLSHLHHSSYFPHVPIYITNRIVSATSGDYMSKQLQLTIVSMYIENNKNY